MTFATALRAADWRDPDVLQAYALEQQARSKVLYALGGEDYSETALQAGLQAFERRLTLHQTNGGRSGGVVSAYNALGDQRNRRGTNDDRYPNSSEAA